MGFLFLACGESGNNPGAQYSHDDDHADHGEPGVKPLPEQTGENKGGDDHDNADADFSGGSHEMPPSRDSLSVARFGELESDWKRIIGKGGQGVKGFGAKN